MDLIKYVLVFMEFCMGPYKGPLLDNGVCLWIYAISPKTVGKLIVVPKRVIIIASLSESGKSACFILSFFF